MGWLWMSRHSMGQHSTPKQYLDNAFTYRNEQPDGTANGLRVLESACDENKVYYAAAQIVTKDVPGDVICVVCLVGWKPNASDNMHFGYKDMDETMGPYEANCPARILRRLSPTDRENALDWRRRCLTNLRLRMRPIEEGMKVRFPNPITFTNDYSGTDFVVVKRGSKWLFRPTDGGLCYAIRNFLDLPWSIIHEPKVHRTIFLPPPALTLTA